MFAPSACAFAALLLACAAPPPSADSAHGGASDDALHQGLFWPLGPRPMSLASVPSFGSNPGGLGMYEHVPAKAPEGGYRGIVVVLHGCSQAAADATSGGWNALADELGFIVVYPEARANGGCFAWWDPARRTRDQGQALSIRQMVEHVRGRFGTAPAFVAGFSAGGAMAAALLAAYPDFFEAGAALAGVPFDCARSEGEMSACVFSSKHRSADEWGDLVRAAAPAPARYPRVALWQGSADPLVAPANLGELVAQWTDVHGFSEDAAEASAVGPARLRRYRGSAGEVLVEAWSIGGMGHGVPVAPARACGQRTSFSLDVDLCSAREVLDFFGRGAGSAPPPTPAVDGGVTVPEDPDAGAALDAGAEADAGAPPQADAGAECAEVYANNFAHVQAGRAALCQPVTGHVCTVGGGDDLGLYSVGSSSWVRQLGPGRFHAGRCSEASAAPRGGRG